MFIISSKWERLITWSVYVKLSGFLYCNLGLAVSTVLMWLADLGSRSNGDSNHLIRNYLKLFFLFPLVLYALYILYILWHTFCQVTALLETLELQESAQRKGHLLFGAGAHQVQGCAAGLLQSVSVKNVLWKSSHGPRHDSAARHR